LLRYWFEISDKNRSYNGLIICYSGNSVDKCRTGQTLQHRILHLRPGSHREQSHQPTSHIRGILCKTEMDKAD